MFISDSVIILFVVLIVLVVLINIWYFSRSRHILEKWAAQNGYEIVRSEYRMLRKGPFFWSSSRGQSVYYVVVRDARGAEHTGWVRCGSWWWGLMSDQVEVKWEQ
jgi:hypothetical protein